MNAILALAPIGSWTIVEFAIAIVIVAAIVALVYIALQQFGVAIPPWVIRVFWIIVVAVVVIFAIKFVAAQI